MDLQKAAESTLYFIYKAEFNIKAIRVVGTEGTHLELHHIAWMLEGIILGYIQDEKAHRWLGWAQATICQRDLATVHELKLINKNS